MKAGDYVRTKYGSIYKIDEIGEYSGNVYATDDTIIQGIIKSSQSLIDLIEVGDLVKIEFYSPRYEERVTRLFEVEYKDTDWIRFNNAHCDLSIFHNQWGGNDKDLNPIIKFIITHEQIESMEYKVKE